MPNELIHNPMFHHFSKTVSVVWIENSSNISIIINKDKPFQVFQQIQGLEQDNYFENTLFRAIGSHTIDFIHYIFWLGFIKDGYVKQFWS